jgi:hypothetical protein
MSSFGEGEFYEKLFSNKNLKYEKAAKEIADFWEKIRSTSKYKPKDPNEPIIATIKDRIVVFKLYGHEDWAWKDIAYLEKNYPKADVAQTKGALYYEKKDYSKALEQLLKSYKTFNMTDSLERIAICQIEIGKHSEAEKTIKLFEKEKLEKLKKDIKEGFPSQGYEKYIQAVVKRLRDKLEKAKKGEDIEL